MLCFRFKCIPKFVVFHDLVLTPVNQSSANSVLTYSHEISLQLIQVLKNIFQRFACAHALCCFKLCGVLCRHALWMRLYEELGRRLAKVVDHSLSCFPFGWICDGIEINSTYNRQQMNKTERLAKIRFLRLSTTCGLSSSTFNQLLCVSLPSITAADLYEIKNVWLNGIKRVRVL